MFRLVSLLFRDVCDLLKIIFFFTILVCLVFREHVYMCRGSFYYCTYHQDRFLPAPSTSAADHQTDLHNGNSLVPKPQAFHRMQYVGLGTRLHVLVNSACAHSLLAKWRRVSSLQMKDRDSCEVVTCQL